MNKFWRGTGNLWPYWGNSRNYWAFAGSQSFAIQGLPSSSESQEFESIRRRGFGWSEPAAWPQCRYFSTKHASFSFDGSLFPIYWLKQGSLFVANVKMACHKDVHSQNSIIQTSDGAETPFTQMHHFVKTIHEWAKVSMCFKIKGSSQLAGNFHASQVGHTHDLHQTWLQQHASKSTMPSYGILHTLGICDSLWASNALFGIANDAVYSWQSCSCRTSQ